MGDDKYLNKDDGIELLNDYINTVNAYETTEDIVKKIKKEQEERAAIELQCNKDKCYVTTEKEFMWKYENYSPIIDKESYTITFSKSVPVVKMVTIRKDADRLNINVINIDSEGSV